MPSAFLTPRRLTPATDAYDQEQAAVADVNQRAAGQDVVGQQVEAQKAYAQQNRDAQANAARIQRAQETAQRKQETEQREVLGRQKKAGIKTKIDDAGREQIVTHENGAPMYQHGFQGDPEATPDGHVVKYRTPHGQVIPVPTNAIRSTQDEAGAPQYEFDVPKEDGTKETIRQPVGSKPLFSIDPKTGMRYTGAADPNTGSVGTTPIGYDPTARSKAVLEQEKLKFTQQQEASKFQADEINLAQNAKETNLAPLKKQLTEAEAEAKRMAKEKLQYKETPEGIVSVSEWGESKIDPATDTAGFSKARAWLDKKTAADKTLADIKGAHDPLAAEVLSMQQQRDALAIQHLKASHETQVQLKRMEEAHKAGIPVYQPDWQKRLDAARTDPRITAINAQADLDETGGGTLAEDVRRVQLPETGKLVNRLINSAFNQRPEFDIYGRSTAATPPMQRPELTLANVIGQELSADNVAPKGSDVKALTESALGISDPENWQIKPHEGDLVGRHDLIHKGQPIGMLNTADNRIELSPPTSAGMDSQQKRLINTNRDGLPIYYSSGNPPLPAPAVKGLIQQGLEIGRSTPDQSEAEAKLAAAQLAPADIREKVLTGQLSVQDGRLLNETFHGIEDLDASKQAIAEGFTKHLASPVLGKQFFNGDLAAKQEIVNSYMDSVAEKASMNVIKPNLSDLAKYRQELLNTIDTRSKGGKLVDAALDAPKNILAPMAGIAAQLALMPYHAWNKLAGKPDEELDIIYNSSRDLGQRLLNDSNPLHRMFGQGEMKVLLNDDLRRAADEIQSVDDLPDKLVQRIRDAAYDGYHRFTDANAKDVGTTRETFDIKKDPTLRAMMDRYLKTADGGTFDGMLQMLSMTGNDRVTQKQTMKYLERPQVATTDNVIDRAKLLEMNLEAGRAASILDLGKKLDIAKEPEQFKNIVKQAGKAMGLEKPSDIIQALSLLTREETDKPDSARALFRGGKVADIGETLTEVGSSAISAGLTASIVGAPAGVALKGAQIAARQGVKQFLKAPVSAIKNRFAKIVGGSMDALAEKSTRFASTRAALAKAGTQFKELGITKPTFGNALTKGQKAKNLAVGIGKAALADAVPESLEEGVSALTQANPTPQGLVDSMVMGALGGTVLAPMFAGASSLNRAFGASARNQSITDYKAGLVDKFNERMAGQPGFNPMTVDDFDIMQGIQENPAQQAALQEHAAAIQELGAAQEEHTQSMMEMQDAAAGNAVADVPPSPRLLAAQAGAEATAANVEGLASMAFSATDELRALPPAERPLYTGVAKAVSGAQDYTQDEAKALMGLGGESAVAFQQAETIPADISGPRQVKTLPGAPTVQQTGLGSYRLPPGVRIQVPQQAIDALQQRAPSLTGLIGGTQQVSAPVQTGAKSANTAQSTGSVVPQQNGVEQPAPSPTPYSGVAPALETRLKQHGLTVSYTPEEQAEVNQKWGASSPFNTPATFVQGGKGTAKALPKGAVMDDTPIAEDEVLSAVQNAVDFELRKRNTIAGRALVVPSFYQSHDGGADYNYGNDTVRVNPLRLARSIWNDRSAAPTRAEIARAAELVIDHEVVHAAQMQAAKDTFAKLPAAEQAQGFMPWLTDHYGKMWNEDLKDVQEATIKAYGSILQGRPDWHKAFEALRMIVQDRVAGSTSEAATFLTERIREHLKAALAVLKRWYADVMAGVADKPAIKAEIEAIEALLKDPVKNNSPGKEPAQAASTGAEVSTTGTSSASPVKGSTETVASTDGADSITNEKQSRVLNVPLSKRGQVRAAQFPDAASVAAFQFKQDADTAANARAKPEEVTAAKQRGLALIASLMQDSPLSRSALEQKLLDYHNAVVAQAEATSPLDTFTPPPFAAFDKIETKAEVLPAPEGGDIISELKREGVKRIGPPAATPEWDWYNELARDAAASKLSNREAQRLARAGDITDPKARIAWINANIVSLTGGRSLDEAAEDITASGEELGRAILDALDARQKAAGQPNATAGEATRAAQEKEGQASFNTFATGSEGTPATAGDLSRTVDAGWEINIGGEWMGVLEADPIDETVTLENPRFGSVTISGEQIVNITGEPQPPLDGASHPPITHIMPDGYALTEEGMQSIGSAPTRAYHGTPHKVDKFSLNKIGTGEGAQAYGWGLYFAGNKAVAQQYQKGLTERDFINKIRQEFSEHDDQQTALDVIHGLDLSEGQRALIDVLAKEDWWGFDFPHQAVQAAIHEPQNFDPSPAVLDALDKFGQLYTVDLLPTDDELLDWDSPLSEQSEKVKEALTKAPRPISDWMENGAAPYIPAEQAYKSLYGDTAPQGQSLVSKIGQAKPASDALLNLGIKGIRYLDGGSRFKMQQTSHAWEVLNGAGKLVAKEPTEAAARAAMEKLQTRNYVIFDENLVRIIAENGKPVESLASAPSRRYQSPTSMLAATQAQMQGKEGEKPAGLQSMFNPKPRIPVTGERSLFEMPKKVPAADLELASQIVTNLGKVKAVRALLPPEQAAYDKATADLKAQESLGSAPSGITAEQAQSAGFTMKAYRGISKSKPFNESGTVWATDSRSVAKEYAEEIMGYEDPDVAEMLINPTDIPRHDMRKLGDEEREALDADAYGNPQKIGIYHNSDDSLSGGRQTVIHVPLAATLTKKGDLFYPSTGESLASAPTESAPPAAQSDKSAQVREIIDSMPKVWQDVLRDFNDGKSIEDIAKDRLYSVAQTTNILTQAQGRFAYLQGQLSTKPKVAPVSGGEPLLKGGRPDLAFSGIPAFAAVDQNRVTPEEVTHAEMQDAATRMFAVDPVAAEKLVTRWMDSGVMAFSTDDMPEGIKAIVADAYSRKASMALMTAAAQIFTVESSFAGGNSAKIARLIDLYRNSGEEIARALSQRRDPFETPAERNAWYLQNVLLVPPPSIRQQMKKNPGNKDKILAEWAARADKIKAEMLADGIDLDATFKQMAKERELAAATIPEAIKAPLAIAPKSTRQAVKAILEGGSWQDALNASGLDLKAAQKAYNAFRGGLRGMISKAAAAIRDTLGSAPNESEPMLPEWKDGVDLNHRPIQNKATQALAIQRNRKMTQGELDLGNDLSANKARRAIEARKSTEFDKLSEFWRASILSGPQTGIVNVVSGLTYGTYEATFKKFSAAALADLARVFGMKPDAPSLRDLPAMASALVPAFQSAGRDMVKAWNTEDAIFDSFALNRTNEKGELWKEGHTSALKGWVRKIMHAISFRHMGAADEFVKSLFTRIEVVAQARQIARNEGLEGLKMANRISELMVPGSLAWERSLANAKRITFQNQEVGNVKLESPLQSGHGAIDSIDHIAEFIQNAKNGDYGKLLKGLTHVVFPFVATPANILKGGITMSPVGGALAIIDATRALMRHKQGNVEEAQRIYNAARALDDFTNQLVCWGFILGLSSLVKPGDDDEPPVITGTFGSGESSPGERELAYRAAPPQSVRLWGHWYSYKRLDPWASWLAPTIDSIREFQLGKSLDEAIPNVIGNMLKAIKEKSYFQGVSEIVNAANDPARFGQRWALGIATGFMPNAIKQSLRASDETIRDPHLPKDMGFVDQLGRRLGFGMLPHPSNPLALMPAIDVFGRPVTKSTGSGGPATDTLIRLLSPVEIRNAGGVDPADRMLMHYNMMHEKPFGLVAPDFEIQRTIAGKPVKISLSFEEREGLAKRIGQDFRAAIQPYVDKPTLPTEDEMEDIKDLHRKIAKPYEDAAFGSALQKRISEGKIKL